jgi:hypothetical protein
MQTVYHAHTPEAAGMILVVKELVEVENVPASAVRTAEQQRAERKAPGGSFRGWIEGWVTVIGYVRRSVPVFA